MNVVFLDIDGVLNDSKTVEKCGYHTGISTKLLNNLFCLVNETNSKIVLISSWKEGWFKDRNLKKKQNMFGNYLDKRFASANMHIYDKINDDLVDRGSGIVNFINVHAKKHNGINFIIIDDELFDYEKEKLTNHLIRTNYYNGGLNTSKTNDAINLMLTEILFGI